MPELLVPAGDFEKLKIAFLYGADAVYFGGQNFGMRANAKNFSLEDIKQAVLIAHKINKKVYVTVNIIFHQNDLEGLKKYLCDLDDLGVDAIIIVDLIVAKYVKELNLKLELHLSTQASVLNAESVKFYKSLGITRIVLAREASYEDIKAIKQNVYIEIECFIHGAMCMSFSGQCVLSNYCTNRDANRGGCAQLCRWEYQCDDQNNFTMMPKDLNMTKNIARMLELGVNSFKIEGRMRSIYYVATVCLIYRRLIDKIMHNNLDEAYINYCHTILYRCANRDSQAQFFDGIPNEKDQYFTDRVEVSNQDFLGIVLEYDDDHKIVTLEQRNYFKNMDEVTFFGPNIETTNYQIKNLMDEENNDLEIANHPKMIVKFPCEIKLNKDDMMRIRLIDKN